MGNLFVNLPVPTSNAAGAAVDVSAMGATKTIIVGGPFQGTVTIEYSNDDGAAVWAPVPNSSFVNQPGRVTIDLAVKWMRAVMDAYKGGSANADVGAPAALASFAAISVAPVDISAMSSFKTVVSPAANLVEISEDGTSWSQAFSFQNGGGQSAVVVGRLARCLTGMVWMGGSPTGDGGSDVEFPAPFVSPPEVITIYIRATGDDVTGDGKTIATAYRTVQRATLDIPRFVPEGVYYKMDATDLIDGGPEILPPNYDLPTWKSGRAMQFGFGPGFLWPPVAVEANVLAAVTLQATPRNVPALGAEAVIDEGDLETTDVATIASTTAGPITVTTTAPHKLVQSPFGIDGFFEGFVQAVEISGAVDPAANGVFLALVTKPTNDESTTFELWDFDPNTETFFQIIGIGGGAGGTVTVFYVQDQRSGNTDVRVSTPRASWLPNGSLKGKMLIDGSGDHGVIYDNTDTVLLLTHNRGSVSFDNGPIRIMEQSCILQCSDSELFGYTGGFNVDNQDSFSIQGIEVRASADGSGFFQFSGLCMIESCKLEAPVFFDPIHHAFVGNSYLIRPFYFRCNIYQNRCLIDDGEVNGIPEWDAHQGTVFIQNDLPIFNPLGGAINWFSVKVISQTDPVIDIICEDALFTGVSIEGGSGDAVRLETQGRCTMLDVGGSGWPGNALVVDNGAQAQVDVWSFVKTDTMLVGNLPVRTFDDFRTNVPLLQYYDLTVINPVTGAEGTGSRAFQK